MYRSLESLNELETRAFERRHRKSDKQKNDKIAKLYSNIQVLLGCWQ